MPAGGLIQERSSASTSKFRADIQGLRAVAIVAVVLYHAGLPLLPGGYTGVDVFFVISGFLITSHLLRSLQDTGSINLLDFYARRARRILPASLMVAALSVVAALIWMPPLLMREVWRGAVATVFYVPNYLFAAKGTNYLAESTPSLFQHYWSLGIEEQFYLIWPVVVLLGFKWIRRPSQLLVLIVALVVASFALCVHLTFDSQPWAFFSLPTRAWELGVGGIVAFVLSFRFNALPPVVIAAIGWCGIAGIGASVLLLSSAVQFPGVWAAMPTLATAAVILAGSSESSFSPSHLLSGRVLGFLGRISYSLYLVHWPLLVIPQAAAGYGRPLPFWATLALGLVSIPVAWLSFRFIEEPGRKARWLAEKPRRALLAAGAASLVVAVIASSTYAYSRTVPLHDTQAAPPLEISAFPNGTPFVPSNLRPNLRSAAEDVPPVYKDGCQASFASTAVPKCIYGVDDAPRIVLFGDSHAAQWFPAIHRFAESKGYAVESHTKSSCPSVMLDVDRDGVPYSECSVWRQKVINRINSESPALVLIANYGQVSPTKPTGDYGKQWGDALSKTLGALSAPTAVIADTPNLGTTPSICLSDRLERAFDCGKSRVEALSGPARPAERHVTANSGTALIDLTDVLCDETFCAPIIDNALVYRDAHHLTATFSAALSDAVGSQLKAVLSNRQQP